MYFKISNISHPKGLNLISFPGNIVTLMLLLRKSMRSMLLWVQLQSFWDHEVRQKGKKVLDSQLSNLIKVYLWPTLPLAFLITWVSESSLTH